eukprot:scaffold5.g752.t1
MAETIPAQLAGLAATSLPTPEEIAENEANSQAAALRRTVGDEDFPFASGAIHGIKCCTKCGATKTPQWREGPLGAKSLCNACGVKRTRKLRAEQEGGKRRKLSASPTKTARHAATSSYAEPSRLDSVDCYDAFYPPYAPAYAAQPPARGARPTRRAAEEAQLRTAHYASTGEWAAAAQRGAGGGLPPWAAAVAAAAAGGGDDTPTASGSGDSLPGSDCPEEVSWAPAGAVSPFPGPAPPLDLDSCAAVNLLTMGLRRQRGGAACARRRAPAPRVSLPPAPALAASPVASVGQSAAAAEQANHDVLLAMAAQCREAGEAPGPGPHAVAVADLPALAALLPPAKLAELVRLNQELESAVHEAAACGAAVAAVAQVLAAKQAAALGAREAAVGATKRLRRFMAELDTQFGIQSKFQAAPAAAPAPALAPAPAAPPAAPKAE